MLKGFLDILCCYSGTIIRAACGVRLKSRGFQLLFGVRIESAALGAADLGVAVTSPSFVGFKAISSVLQSLRYSLWPIYRLLL